MTSVFVVHHAANSTVAAVTFGASSRYTGWRKKRGHPISLQIFWIACKLVNFCNIICRTQSLTFCLKISSRCSVIEFHNICNEMWPRFLRHPVQQSTEKLYELTPVVSWLTAVCEIPETNPTLDGCVFIAESTSIYSLVDGLSTRTAVVNDSQCIRQRALPRCYFKTMRSTMWWIWLRQ